MSRPSIDGLITWVYTDELASAVEFYADTLGLECVREAERTRIFAAGTGACIGVCETFDDRVVAPEGSLISLVVDDVDAWYRRLDERGADIESPPHRLEQFGIYTFFARDPSGYRLEFQQFLENRER